MRPLTPEEIAHKYVHGLHDALTDSQETKDMAEDIYDLIRTVHFNACVSTIKNCGEHWGLMENGKKNIFTIHIPLILK